MSTLSFAIRDSRTMLRRNLRRMARYPSLTLMVVGMPVLFLLLFVYVFGGALGAGLGLQSGGRAEYVNYVVPGIILMAVGAAVQGTTIAVAMDMSEGIIARFRTMAISRTSVLNAHVISSLIQAMGSITIVVVVAVLVGFRPDADPIEWLAAVGLVAVFAFALVWLSLALGLNAKSVETASNAPMFLLLLPFLGSAVVPTESMPTALRLFADYQPFTLVIETLRGLLLGTAINSDGAIAIIWCVGIGVGSYIWAKRLFDRPPMSRPSVLAMTPGATSR